MLFPFRKPLLKYKKREGRRSENLISYGCFEERKLLAIDFTGGGVPDDQTAQAYLFVGDHSGSNSEIYQLSVGGQSIAPAEYGEVRREQGVFERGQSYDVGVNWISSNRQDVNGNEAPDYDYRAWVDRTARPRWTSGSPTPVSQDFFVTDSAGLFQRRYFGSGTDSTLGKAATIHFPAIDIDVDSGNSGSLDRSLREDQIEADAKAGLYLSIFDEDLDDDGVVDNYDFDGIANAEFSPVSVSLSSNLSHLQDAENRLVFNFDDAGFADHSAGLFRLWTKNAAEVRTADDLIVSGVEYDAAALGLTAGASTTLFLEAVNPTRRTVNFDPLQVTGTVSSSSWSGSLTDEVHARGIYGEYEYGGSEDDESSHTDCEVGFAPDGEFDAVNDYEKFFGENLEAGGIRNIDVLSNDLFTNSYGSSQSLSLVETGFADPVYVLNAPPEYELFWYQSISGTGSYSFGSYSLEGEFIDAVYHGTHAHAIWAVTLTVSADGMEEQTFSASYSACQNIDYDSDDFGETIGAISGSVSSDSGTRNVLITLDTFYGIREGETGYFDVSGEISAFGVDIVDFTQPQFGTSQHDGGPVITYTPEEGTEEKSDSFTYTIANLIGQTDTATVFIEALDWIDLDTDSNNDGNIDETDDPLENKNGELGNRIFRNADDDNKNGKPDINDTKDAYNGVSDNDFSKQEIKFDTDGEELPDNTELWYFVPNGSNVWADEQKTPFVVGQGGLKDIVVGPLVDRTGRYYIWEPSSETFSVDAYLETGTAARVVPSLLLRIDGQQEQRDDVRVNAESIVYPSLNQANGNWNELVTSSWDGIDVADAWFIDKSLLDYIKTPADKGTLATIHPTKTVGGKAASTAEGEDSTSTDSFANGFTLEYDYRFDHSRGTGGYVQIVFNDNVLDKLSAVANSGVKFGSYERSDGATRPFEASVLDVDALVDLAGGINSVTNFTSDEGIVSVGGYAPEPINRLLTGVEYGGLYGSISDNALSPETPDNAADFASILQNNANRSNEQNSMKIEVRAAGQGLFDVTITVNGSVSYRRDGLAIASIEQFSLQAHWGSGVIFSNVKTTKH